VQHFKIIACPKDVADPVQMLVQCANLNEQSFRNYFLCSSPAPTN
jgi:hypothetical protein